jgi:hypothetical protein
MIMSKTFATDKESKRLAEEAYPSKYKPSPAQQNYIAKAAAVAMLGVITSLQGVQLSHSRGAGREEPGRGG